MAEEKNKKIYGFDDRVDFAGMVSFDLIMKMLEGEPKERFIKGMEEECPEEWEQNLDFRREREQNLEETDYEE